MNEPLPPRWDSPPIASPNDRRPLQPTQRAGFTVVFGHFLTFGFVGQLVFTVLQLSIVNNTHGKADAPASMLHQLMLLCLPVGCAIAGAVTARQEPFRGLGHPLVIALTLLFGGMLGLFNLIVWALTGMSGYC